MRVTFAGVGEAFDEYLTNTSILVESGPSSILLDCGFSAPPAFWRATGDPTGPDMISISHFHADHYFGIPALLARNVQEGRTRRLTILGPVGVEKRVTQLVEMAYANLLTKACFDIYFIECTPGDEFRHEGFRFGFAHGDHPMPCLGVRLDVNGKSLFYSGDGRPTPATAALAAGCDLIIQEAFTLDEETPGHGTIQSAIEFAAQAGADACAMVHVSRQVRHAMKGVIMTRVAAIQELRCFLPEPGDVVEL